MSIDEQSLLHVLQFFSFRCKLVSASVIWYLWRCAPSLRSALVRKEVETIYYDLVHGEQRVVGVLLAFYLRTAVFSFYKELLLAVSFHFMDCRNVATPQADRFHLDLRTVQNSDTRFGCCSTKTEEMRRRRSSSTLGCATKTRVGG